MLVNAFILTHSADNVKRRTCAAPCKQLLQGRPTTYITVDGGGEVTGSVECTAAGGERRAGSSDQGRRGCTLDIAALHLLGFNKPTLFSVNK